MAEETKAPPTVAELEGKVQRLTNQATIDGQNALDAGKAFAQAVKSGDVDRALELADARGKANAALGKTNSQLKTATNAVNSQKLQANAGKRADIHDAMRQDKSVVGHVKALFALGADWVNFEEGEGDEIIVNSGGADIRKTRAPGSGGGGNRGTASWEVDGQSFTSRELIDAHPDLLTDKVREHYESGNFRAFSMTREAERIHEKLTSGN
ncbi:hypothetical protein LCGC14_0964460 [marine sediment metagenome]|uniref:Uncharacterized protein n=1 Tax=marine sediment metagenome TaxID=412755 RepID=A0A0F9NDL1_9ZZZZ